MIKKNLKFTILHNILLLITGSFLAQILPIFFEPFLKRIYGPEDFGKLSLFIKLFNIFIIISTCSYEMGIIIAKDEEEAKILINGNILLSIFCFTITEIGIIILLFLNILNKNFYFLLFLPFAVLFYSIGLCLNNYLIKKEEYKKVSKNKIVRRISEIVSQIGTGFISPSLYYLIIGNTIGNFFYMIYNFLFSDFKLNINIKKIKETLLKYKEFPRYNLLPRLFNTFALNMFDFLILIKFSLIEVGYLELTQKVLLLPSALLGESISRVILQTTALKINNKESIKKEIKYIFLFLLLISIIFFIIIFLFAEILFKFIFGERWIKSGIYAKYMIFYACTLLSINPLSSILISLRKLKINSLWQCAQSLLILSLFLLNFTNILNFIYLYTVYNCILYIIYLIIIFKELNKYEKNLLKNV